MMNQETLRKLTEMKMVAMAELYHQQSENKDYQAMDFDDRFNLLVDYEYDRRKSNRLERLKIQQQPLKILNIIQIASWTKTSS